MRERGRRLRNMDEFAAVSGVSRPTVSKYFHDPMSVRPSTRLRIEEALEKYEFRPNVYAVNQNRRQTRTIGVVVPYLADPFFAEIARVIERRCVELGYRPLLFSANGDHAVEAEVLDSLLALKPAGALIAPHANPDETDALAAFARRVPTVLFDSRIEGLGAAFVGHDNEHSIAELVDYLCDTGPAPSYFEMEPVNPNADMRRRVYARAMERRGLQPMVVRVPGTGWDFEAIGRREGLRVLREGALPSQTVLCGNDRLAIGLLSAAFALGVTVGKHASCALRVAGHDDHPFSRYACPALTTVRQNYDAIADASLEALFAAIEGSDAGAGEGAGEGKESGSATTTLFKGELILRDSA